MARAYTPGLKVSGQTRHKTRRILPIPGEVLVKKGDRVQAEDIVAQTFMPGDITPVNVANKLSLPPVDVIECMLKKAGDRIEIGDAIACTKGIFGFFKSELKSTVAGEIESISEVTGQMIVRGEPLQVRVLAYLTGEVVEVIPNSGVVIESNVAMIQGIFGLAGEAFGTIRMACGSHNEELTADLITSDMLGQIVIGGARMTGDAVRKAIAVGASAVVSGGMDDQDVKDILGYDLGVAITGSEKIGTTVLITEGFGEISMAERTFKLLGQHEGREASVNGATQIRAGVMRPEILIPLEAGVVIDEESKREAGLLEIGTPIRVIRDPHFGIIGDVCELPTEPAVLESGSKARVLSVKFASGSVVTVPRANVEIIGE
ncbi:MAG: hypothetical protein O3A00_00195 [Planctomycetota bacterium]|nr:hypothetical protein [Planctomycetota bacterium]